MKQSNQIKKGQKVRMFYGDKFYNGTVVATENSSVSSSDEKDNVSLIQLKKKRQTVYENDLPLAKINNINGYKDIAIEDALDGDRDGKGEY